LFLLELVLWFECDPMWLERNVEIFLKAELVKEESCDVPGFDENESTSSWFSFKFSSSSPSVSLTAAISNSYRQLNIIKIFFF